jgi:hypothetical protein
MVRRRRHKQLLDGRMETTGYWKLKEEALDRTPWRNRFGIRPCSKADNRMIRIMIMVYQYEMLKKREIHDNKREIKIRSISVLSIGSFPEDCWFELLSLVVPRKYGFFTVCCAT